jgi:hypothetical protein
VPKYTGLQRLIEAEGAPVIAPAAAPPAPATEPAAKDSPAPTHP